MGPTNAAWSEKGTELQLIAARMGEEEKRQVGQSPWASPSAWW
ncbi:MAG TPA: hypothetical protein VGJ94_11650 [Syntrophorhabdaceae bacterium]